jgi:hypothetical protein
MWSDNIAERDYLGFDVHAELIKGLIDEPGMLPITIGVFGDWGSGKSSIMESLRKAYDIENEKSIVCLQFNGWVLEGYDDAKAALIESILKRFEENKSLPQKAKAKLKKLSKSVKWMRAIGFGVKNVAVPLVAASLTGGLSLGPQIFEWIKSHVSDPQQIADAVKDLDFDKFKEKYLNEDAEVSIEEQYQVVRKFRDDFKEMLDESNVNKLIVLIDDLDRCLPDRIIDNLEAIKLFLNVENTAFVIGADQRIVRDAIRHRYKDLIARDEEEENKRVVVDYLEKLIQIPYNLPKLSESEVETYITLLFSEDEFGKDEMDDVINAFKEYRKSDRYSVFGIEQVKLVVTDPKARKRLEEKVTLISKLSPLIAGNLDGNPRQIKRFLNTFMLRKKLADVAKLTDFKVDVLAKLMILEYAEPRLFSELYRWQSQNKGYAQPLQKLEKKNGNGEHEIEDKYKDWRNPKLLTWLDSKPYLANVDLRDYFWISRDRLESMSDALTPPIVTSIIAKLMIKQQGDNVIHTKIKEDVLTLQTNLQQVLYSTLSKRAVANKGERTQIFKIFEFMIDDGCPCESEFREMCKNSRIKSTPALKEIVERISESHQEFKNLLS